MLATLFHPGDLGLLGLLELLLLVVGIPALVISVLAYAIYKGMSVQKKTFTTIHLEGKVEPYRERGRRADSA
jgi:hypothetical protein